MRASDNAARYAALRKEWGDECRRTRAGGNVHNSVAARPGAQPGSDDSDVNGSEPHATCIRSRRFTDFVEDRSAIQALQYPTLTDKKETSFGFRCAMKCYRLAETAGNGRAIGSLDN